MVRIIDLDEARRTRGRRTPPRQPRPPSRLRRILLRILVAAVVIALVALAANWRSILPQTATDGGLVGLYLPPAALRGAAGVPAPVPTVKVAATRFPPCGGSARVDCVVDGDTIWLGGSKIRIADINTPELSSSQCAAERRLAERAAARLQALLEEGPFELRAQGRDEDRYGRKLRTLVRDGRSLGDTLVAEGLAHPWTGRRRSWCG
ncbi:thermonuclease family protein [Aquibium microcysteis]|uniref:thermonuclease family protein n=1 Tax=Aquibium microcysteis TaxID=675281 RepID=UPI00165D00F8|nr:thermonuclease family protein [Aquibium microcysteis]